MDPIFAKFILILVGVVIGAGLAYAGYDLFRRGIGGANTGRLEAPGVKVDWTAAGPGAFFIVLGAIIVLVAVTRPFTRTDKVQDGFGGSAEHSYSAAAGPSSETKTGEPTTDAAVTGANPDGAAAPAADDASSNR